MTIKLHYSEAWQIANGHDPIYTKEVQVDPNTLNAADRELLARSYDGSTPLFRQLRVCLPNGESDGFLTQLESPAKNDLDDLAAALAAIRARQAAYTPPTSFEKFLSFNPLDHVLPCLIVALQLCFIVLMVIGGSAFFFEVVTHVMGSH